MTEQDWLTTDHVGSMLRYLTHEVHAAPDAIGDHRRAHPLIGERQITLFDEACWERFHLNIDDVAVQQPPTPGAADLLRDIVGNPFRPVSLCGNPDHGSVTVRPYCPACNRFRTPTVLSLAGQAYQVRCRGCEKCYDGWRAGECISPCPNVTDGTLDPLTLAAVADALEEAGATGMIVDHLRGWEEVYEPLDEPGVRGILLRKTDRPHVRGCWALDLILGKE